MAKPPKTPPQHQTETPAPKSDELRKEEKNPAKVLKERTAQEKGLPKDAKTSWN